MRLSFIILLISLFNTNLIGQRLILPKENKNFVFDLHNGSLDKIGQINYPITRLIKIDNKGRAFCIDTANRQLLIANILTKNFNDSIKRIDIPENLKPISLEVHKGVVFIGGNRDKEKILTYRIHKKSWGKLDIPKKIMIVGKSIDDFVITGDTLIALDDIVMPKYLLFYDLSNLEDVKLIKKYTVPPNGTYETLKRILIVDKYFVILSSTYGGSYGLNYYVTVLKRHNLPDYASYQKRRSENFHKVEDPRPEEIYKAFTVTNGLKNFWYLRRKPNLYPDERWVDITEKDGQILIAEQPNRIGKLKIKEKYFKARKIIGFWYNDEDFIQIIDKRKIRFSSTWNKEPHWFVEMKSKGIVFLIYKDKNDNYGFKKM